MTRQDNLNTKELQDNYNKWWGQKEILFPESAKNKRHCRRVYNKIIRPLKPFSDGKLLDVCCSNGTFLSFMEENTQLSLYGLDISTFAIDSAGKKLKRAKVCVGDAQDMNVFENNYFDYVTCLGSIEHLLDPSKGIREIGRVLKTDGKVLIMVPNLYFLGHIYMAMRYGVCPSEGGQEFSEMFSTVEGWKKLLAAGGLEIISVYKYNEIRVTTKVSKGTTVLWNMFNAFVPLNLSYCFIFICKK